MIKLYYYFTLTRCCMFVSTICLINIIVKYLWGLLSIDNTSKFSRRLFSPSPVSTGSWLRDVLGPGSAEISNYYFIWDIRIMDY